MPSEERPRLQRLERWWRRLPYSLTFSGLVFVGISLFILLATLNSGTNLLYFAFGIAVGVFVASVVLSGVSLRKVTVERRAGEHLVAGEPSDIDYVFTNHKRFWPCLAVSFEELSEELTEAPGGFILYLPARSSAVVSTRLVARRRGMLRLSRLHVSGAFPFGFIRRTITIKSPHDLVIYPRIGMLNRHLALQYRESIESGTMTSNKRGGLDEFYGLREYRPGDNVRAIHWRSTAKIGRLTIKEMAANAPPQMIVVLNLRQAESKDFEEGGAAERAIELAASLTCYGFFENFAVGLAIAGVDTLTPPSPQMGRDARAQMLRRLAVLHEMDIRREMGIAQPNRLAGRAEWIIVTLHAEDPCRDLLAPAGGRGDGGMAMLSPSGALRSSHHTVLALDAPDAEHWLRFLTPEDTLRLLRTPAVEAAARA